MECPPDADLQERYFADLQVPDGYARNQLLFWNGHVALTISETELVHANAHAMKTTAEDINSAITRIETAGHGKVTRHVSLPFPQRPV